MEHVVMVWTQRYKVRQIIGAAVLHSHDVVNRSCVLKSAQDTLTTVADSCCILAGSVARLWNSSECAAVRFLPTFIGTERTLITPSKSRWCDSNRITADFTRDGFAIVERVFFPCSRSPKGITTITGAIDPIRQMRTDIEHVTAKLTRYFSGRFSSTATIVP
jgi:hypothetical protein